MRLAVRLPLVAAVALALLSACSSAGTMPEDVVQQGDHLRGTGTIRWNSLEGGFFAIEGDDGKTYDPVNLPQDFRTDGLRVYFEATIRHDLRSFHMVGQIVEILAIRAL